MKQEKQQNYDLEIIICFAFKMQFFKCIRHLNNIAQ